MFEGCGFISTVVEESGNQDGIFAGHKGNSEAFHRYGLAEGILMTTSTFAKGTLP